MKLLASGISILALGLTGCAESPKPNDVAAAAVPASAASAIVVAHQNCHRENKVGTNLFQTVCEGSQSDREDMREGVGRMMGPQAAGNGISSGR